MKLRNVLIPFLIIITSAYSVAASNYQCNQYSYVPLNTTNSYLGLNITYTGIMESGAYPGYVIDPVYYVSPPGQYYRDNLSYIDQFGYPYWIQIIQPSFKLLTTQLYEDNSVSYTFCVNTEIIQPTPTTPTPTPTIPVTSTATATATPTGTGYNGEGAYGSNSSYPGYYKEGSYTNSLNNSLPSNSTGFKDIMNGMGYSANVGGAIMIMKDYMFFYLLFGMILFTIKLVKF